MKVLCKAVLSIFASAVVGAAFATDRYVDAARPDDSGDGSSWATAKKTIQAAIDIAKKERHGHYCRRNVFDFI